MAKKYQRSDFAPARETETNQKIDTILANLTDTEPGQVRNMMQDAWNGTVGWYFDDKFHDQQRPDHAGAIVLETIEKLEQDPRFADISPATKPNLLAVGGSESNFDVYAIPHLIRASYKTEDWAQKQTVRYAEQGAHEVREVREIIKGKEVTRYQVFDRDGDLMRLPVSTATGIFQLLEGNREHLEKKYPDLLVEPFGTSENSPSRIWNAEYQTAGAFVLSHEDQKMFKNTFKKQRDFEAEPINGGEVKGLHMFGRTTMVALYRHGYKHGDDFPVMKVSYQYDGKTIYPFKKIHDSNSSIGFDKMSVGETKEWLQGNAERYLRYAIDIGSEGMPIPEEVAQEYTRAIQTGHYNPENITQPPGILSRTGTAAYAGGVIAKNVIATGGAMTRDAILAGSTFVVDSSIVAGVAIEENIASIFTDRPAPAFAIVDDSVAAPSRKNSAAEIGAAIRRETAIRRGETNPFMTINNPDELSELAKSIQSVTISSPGKDGSLGFTTAEFTSNNPVDRTNALQCLLNEKSGNIIGEKDSHVSAGKDDKELIISLDETFDPATCEINSGVHAQNNTEKGPERS